MKKSIKKSKFFLKVFIFAALTVFSLGILSSCENNKPDLSSISEIPVTFLEAVKNLDSDAVISCSPEFDTSKWDELDEDKKYILQNLLSCAEITEMGEPVFYEESGSADLEVTFSYLTFSCQ